MSDLVVITKKHYNRNIDLSHLNGIPRLGYQLQNTVLSELHSNETHFSFVSMAKFKGYYINTVSISELDEHLKKLGYRIVPF